jgi:hypothetical protein
MFCIPLVPHFILDAIAARHKPCLSACLPYPYPYPYPYPFLKSHLCSLWGRVGNHVLGTRWSCESAGGGGSTQI